MKSRECNLRTAVLLSIVVVGGACENPLEQADPSWVRATVVQADSSAAFTGDGFFGTTQGFSIASRGQGESEGETVILSSSLDALAAPGFYLLTQTPRAGSFTGVYRRVLEDGTKERYAVTSGEVIVAGSSHERVEGAFSFTAELFCRTPAGAIQGQCHPGSLIPGVEPLAVEGSFSVGPYPIFTVGS
ncbi:MAG: hypothetical protein HKN37_10170 [Rhodothermales bacterium]|nr:hypothetical protein [Rhodothermales bacterium]